MTCRVPNSEVKVVCNVCFCNLKFFAFCTTALNPQDKISKLMRLKIAHKLAQGSIFCCNSTYILPQWICSPVGHLHPVSYYHSIYGTHTNVEPGLPPFSAPKTKSLGNHNRTIFSQCSWSARCRVISLNMEPEEGG